MVRSGEPAWRADTRAFAALTYHLLRHRNSISEVQHAFQEGAGAESVALDTISLDSSQLTPLDDFVNAPWGLPPPELGNLEQIEEIVRRVGSSQVGRDGMAKLMQSENYLAGLTRLVEVAEDLEDLQDLHRLCNIMKNLVLFNDQPMMEYMLSDEIILGVVGALECMRKRRSCVGISHELTWLQMILISPGTRPTIASTSRTSQSSKRWCRYQIRAFGKGYTWCTDCSTSKTWYLLEYLTIRHLAC